MKASSEDKIVYVRCPIFFKSQQSIAFTETLTEMGFHDFSPSGANSDMLALTFKYWCINSTKKCFVGPSKDYGNPTINTEEFLHEYRGRIASNKFKF